MNEHVLSLGAHLLVWVFPASLAFFAIAHAIMTSRRGEIDR